MDASKRAASCPEFGLAALTPRLLSAFILRSAAAAASDLRDSAFCGGCEGRCWGLPVDVRGWSVLGTKVCPPVWLDDLEQSDPICVFELLRYLFERLTGV